MEWKKWKMENNGENSGPLTSLPVDHLTATDCNAAALAKRLVYGIRWLGVALDRYRVKQACWGGGWQWNMVGKRKRFWCWLFFLNETERLFQSNLLIKALSELGPKLKKK